MEKILCLIICIPFFNFFFLYFNIKKDFLKIQLYLSICLIGSIFFCSLYTFLAYLIKGIIYQIKLNCWFDFGGFFVQWGFLFDQLTLSMLLIITAISFFVHLYSLEYLNSDPYKKTFFSYISLFTFFMIILVTANNFLQLFLGWEGVGLCSFLLISFWNTRIQAIKSALKAMIMNRIGDFFLLCAICYIFFFYRTINFIILPLLINFTDNFIIFYNITFLDLIGFFLFVGAVGKSAQIGLHTWLPDAMEGPTPVSALIHAATMVTAGVFLIIRCSFLIEASPFILNLIIFFGAITAFISATISLMQHDIKKIIAYSTCSQLGYMFLSCGFSLYNIALYHLITHAFFKALLFLGAGSIIHSILDEQDIRKMGALKNLLPITYSSMLLGTCAIIGFPFFSGYYSKDLLLENVLISQNSLNIIMYSILILSAFFTVFYSMQLIFWVFLTSTNIARYKYLFITESSWIINSVLICLSILSVFVGYFFFEIYSGVLSAPFLTNSIFISSFINYQNQMEFFLTLFYKNLPLLNGFLGIFFILFFYKQVFYLFIFYKYRFYFIYLFFIKKWYFDIIYNNIGFYFFKKAYTNIYLILDKGFLEYIGPTGFVNFFFQIYIKVFNYQKVSLYYYLFFSLLFVINCYLFYIFN